jgi:predicted nuclease of restriction endonuclease-like (RecB) superfamily
MRQFFEAYKGDEKVSPLVRQLPWTHWSKRALERQIRAAAFERAVLSTAKVSPVVAQMHPAASDIFKDSYLVEFLDLPREHSENDLHRGLVHKLKDFLIELGRDFCFVGSEYPAQVGKRDFELDLLFFHRGLNCLCAIELKVNGGRGDRWQRHEL